MSSPREWLDRYSLRPKKSWGQNFLSDANMRARIGRACELTASDRVVVEIGAGTGALTEQLIAPERIVFAIERDRELVPLLNERFGEGSGVRVIEANAVDWPIETAAREAGRAVKVVGNLPYQITAPLLFKFMDERTHITSAHLLVQKEVGERLVAKPGSKDYSLLTVLLGRLAEVEKAVDVPRSCFYPPPRVDSRFVTIRFKPEVAPSSFDTLFRALVKAAFHQRRKTLANSLSRQPFLDLSADVLAALKDVYPKQLTQRAEEHPVEFFVELAHKVEEQKSEVEVGP